MQEKHFTDLGDFSACGAAEKWLAARGFSVGRMQGKDPRGVLFGGYDIQKWRNLSQRDRAELHATMHGNMRTGPIVVRLRDNVPDQVLRAFLADTYAEALAAAARVVEGETNNAHD